MLLRLRAIEGRTVVAKAGMVRVAKRALEAGNVLAILCDGGAKGSEVQAPFLGVDANTVATPAVLHLMTGAPIIFDDQYLNSLVSIGFLGLAAVIWFVWGAAAKLIAEARRRRGPEGDLIAACAVSCAGFAAGMFTFDAFAFVQCTLLFFVIAALGLRARSLVR